MYNVINIDSIRDKKYFDIIKKNIIDNVDSTIDEYEEDRFNTKMIQYYIVDGLIYLKTFHLRYRTSLNKYINLLDGERVYFRYDIDSNENFIYSGYEVFEKDDNTFGVLKLYNIKNELVYLYQFLDDPIYDFNSEYLKKDSNNNIIPAYYYRINIDEIDLFINFIRNKKQIIIDINILENMINQAFEFNSETIIFGYQEENNFSLYLFV